MTTQTSPINAYFAQGFTLQSVIANAKVEASAARGIANTQEFTQYCLFIFGNRAEGIKLGKADKRSKAFQASLVTHGRSERNALEVARICFATKLSKIAAPCETFEALVQALETLELNTVSKLRRLVDGEKDKLEAMQKAFEKLDEEDREAFVEWLEENGAKDILLEEAA